MQNTESKFYNSGLLIFTVYLEYFFLKKVKLRKLLTHMANIGIFKSWCV